MENIKKKSLLLMDPAPTSVTYKILYYLRDYFDITMISLSTKYYEENYKKLGIKVYSFNFQGERYWRDKKYLKGLKEATKFLFKFFRIKSMKFDYVLARTEPNAIGYFLFKMFPKSKKIYYPYDISVFRYIDQKTQRSKWDAKYEKYCFETADYIIHKGPENELNIIREKYNFKIKGKDIHFLPYCFDPWIMPIRSSKEKLKGISLAYIGGLYYNYKDSDKKLLPDPKYRVQWYEIFKIIGKQKIHLHYYSLDPVKDISDEYIKMFKALPNDELNKKLGDYQFGIHLFFSDPEKTPEYLIKNPVPNKIFSYLEAGIPIIINDEMEYMADLIRKYDCGIVIEEKNLKNLNSIIKKKDYSKLLNGVNKARKDLMMSKNIKRLIQELEPSKN